MIKTKQFKSMKNFILQAKAFCVLTTFLVVMFLGKLNAQNIIGSDLNVCYNCESNYVDFPTILSQNGITGHLNAWKNKVGEPKYFFYEQIILKEEFEEAGGQNGSKINRLRLWINPGDTSTYGDWDVWIGYARSKKGNNESIRKLNKDEPWIEFTTPNEKTKMTKVFSGNIHNLDNPPTENTWFEIPFNQEFTWNGTDHIVIAIHDKTNAIKDLESTSFKVLTYRRPDNPSSGSGVGSVFQSPGLVFRFRTNERSRLHFTDKTSGQYEIITDGSANLPTWEEPQPVGTMPARLNNLFQLQFLYCPTAISGLDEIQAGTITKFSADGESGGTWNVTGTAGNTSSTNQNGELVLTTTSTGSLTLSYSVSGCTAVTKNVTVNYTPTTIIGPDLIDCVGCESVVTDLFDQAPSQAFLDGWKTTVGEPKYIFYQQIIYKEELASADVQAGRINKLKMQLTDIGNTSLYGDWDVWIGHTDKRALGMSYVWKPTTEMTKVYSGNIHSLAVAPANNVWFEIPFTDEFIWNGTDNIVIAFHDKTDADKTNANFKILAYKSPNATTDNFNSNTRNRLHFTDHTTGQYAIFTDGSQNLPTWQQFGQTMPPRLDLLMQLQLLDEVVCPTAISGLDDVCLENGGPSVATFSSDGDLGGTWDAQGTATYTTSYDAGTGNFEIIISAVGTLIVSYEIPGCTKVTKNVTLTQKVDPTFSFGDSNTICESESFVLPTTSTNLTPITGTSCANTKSITVTVTPKVDPTFSFGDSNTICESESFVLPTTSTNPTPITGTWNPSSVDFTIYTEQTFEFTPAVGSCANTKSITVTVTPTPVAPTGEANQNFTAGETIADLVVDGTNLVWYSDSGFTDQLSDSELLVDGTTYYVINEVGNCQSEALAIKVTEVVSRTDFDLYGFKYYPNPVNDVLQLTTNTPIEKVVVSNMLGQQVNVRLSSDKTSLDMSNLPSGNYFVKVTIEGVSKMIKVIKN